MVEIHAVYEGNLRCHIRHGPSGQEISTDAPTDNYGRGEAFSPTDLVGAALGSCLLTVMGIVARRHQIDLTGASVVVRKEMVDRPMRRIAALTAVVTFPRAYSDTQRALLEGAAKGCPVHRSLHQEVEAPIEFRYPS